MRDIVIHAGAHKTASTHLQIALRDQAQSLFDHGVSFYGPLFFREKGNTFKAFIRDMDAKLCDTDIRRVLISDENLLGEQWTEWGLKNSYRFYPAGQRRMNFLNKVEANDRRYHLTLAVRDPASYIKSAYTHALMVGTVKSWDRFVKAADPTQYLWSLLVKELHDLGVFQSITIWRYEDYYRVFEQILKTLLGPDHPTIPIDMSQRHNPGLSEATVAALEKLRAEGFTDNFAAIARTEHPVSAENPAFEPWSADVLRRSAEVYESDLTELVGIPNVTILRPDGAKG